jgi:hypothetical protein
VTLNERFALIERGYMLQPRSSGHGLPHTVFDSPSLTVRLVPPAMQPPPTPSAVCGGDGPPRRAIANHATSANVRPLKRGDRFATTTPLSGPPRPLLSLDGGFGGDAPVPLRPRPCYPPHSPAISTIPDRSFFSRSLDRASNPLSFLNKVHFSGDKRGHGRKVERVQMIIFIVKNYAHENIQK